MRKLEAEKAKKDNTKETNRKTRATRSRKDTELKQKATPDRQDKDKHKEDGATMTRDGPNTQVKKPTHTTAIAVKMDQDV